MTRILPGVFVAEKNSILLLTLCQCVFFQVVQLKTKEVDGYTSVQVGAGLKKLKNVTKPLMGHFARAGVSPKQKLVEFKVSENAVVPVGTKIFAEHFRPGQFIDVRSKSCVTGALRV
jgi:large subunit ribosomal protein L3